MTLFRHPIPESKRIRQTKTLDQKMQLFINGELKGFALDSPYNGINYSDQDWIDLAATGANVVRCPIVMTKNIGGTYYDFPESTVVSTELALKMGEKLGFRVIVVLVTIPQGTDSDFWDNANLKADIISKWIQIANRLKDYSALQAYDILNEPARLTYVEADKTQWAAIAQTIVTPLRAEDPHTPIMIEPCWWALADSFWQHPPVTVSGLVWSMHMYERREIVFQGILGYPTPVTYQQSDKDFMYSNMLETRKFAALYNVPIFVGEFSCMRWAPNDSATTVLTDLIKMFDDEKWGYTYHVWRSYEGFDSEIPYSVAQGAGNSSHRSSSSSLITMLRTNMRKAPRVVSSV